MYFIVGWDLIATKKKEFLLLFDFDSLWTTIVKLEADPV
jgi:hypothetical protein